MPSPSRISGVGPSLAFGPALPGWGSWDWIGADLAAAFTGSQPVSTFESWAEPDADVVLVVKQAPPAEWVERVARRAALIYLPVDFFGTAAEIASGAAWLLLFSRIVVHCERLRRHFETFAPVEYLDHHVKFAAPLRRSFKAEGNILWVGVRSNLPPLAEW